MTQIDDMPDPVDESALRRLITRYALACDRRDGALLASVFATGGVLHGPSFRFATPGEIAKVPESLKRFEKTYHTLLNFLVEVTHDRGTGEVYSMAHHLTPLGNGKYKDLVMYITYRDRYVRGQRGWQIEHREVVVEFTEDRVVENINALKL
jgi:SnoaL-like domain